MKTKILCLVLVSLFLSCFLCACNKQKTYEKTPTSIEATFVTTKLEYAGSITVDVKNRETKDILVLTLDSAKDTAVNIEPGIYEIVSAKADTKRVSVELKEQYFTISRTSKRIEFTVTEDEMGTLAWFFYNNALYLLVIVGCAIALGVVKYKKEQRLTRA